MKNFLLLLCGAAALGGCSEDNDNQPAPARADLLTAKSWRVTAVTTTTTANGNVSVQDDFLTYSPCDRDNFLKFKADKTALQDAGATKCHPLEAQTDTLTWALTQDQTQLLLGSRTSPAEALTIVELSATTLHLRTSQPASGSTSETGDLIYTAF